MFSLLFMTTTMLALSAARISEYIPSVNIEDHLITHDNLNYLQLPQSFSWSNVDGTNYLTKNLNQHIPVYCGSCWAHGSCNGGDHLATYKAIKKYGSIPFEDCMIYQACSSDSKEPACQSKTDFVCTPNNICRTCNTFSSYGGTCNPITQYPNATIAEYGAVRGSLDMMTEIHKNGPIACGINAEEILDYNGGVHDLPNKPKMINHIISIVGWGYDEQINKQYWIIRNSWGSYWGELGFMRLVLGENQLGIEKSCAYAIPGEWTLQNFPCYEDGSNCL